MRIGLLALQGAFREHVNIMEACDVAVAEIRLPEQLIGMDGLIIPGGESTTIAKLLHIYSFIDAIKRFAASGKPIFGTCAGAILVADKKEGKKQQLLNLIDIDIRRNAYGRQQESREVDLSLAISPREPFRAIFIRAPIIESIGAGVTPLAYYQDKVVMARQDNILISTFHPELTGDMRVHRYFLEMTQKGDAV